MTIETKSTIELSDIETVEFECPDCHSVVVWPIGVAKAPPMSCHCDKQKFWMIGNDETYQGISELLALIDRFGKDQPKTFRMRFGLSASDHVSAGKD